MSSVPDGSAPPRPLHLKLVPTPLHGAPTTEGLIEEARGLDKLGRRAEARELYERALRTLAEPSPALASTLLRWIARTYEVDTDYGAAEDCATAAVATAEVGDDRNALGHALNGLAALRWRQGDLDGAEQLFQQALQRGTSATDPRLQVDVMTNLGTMASIRGDFRQALRFFQDALAHGRLHSLLDNIVVALNNLGMANMALGRHEAAEEAFDEALAIANALGGLSMRVQLEVNSASLQLEKRDYEEAKRRVDRAMALAGHLDDARANGEAEKVYGIIARETGDRTAAERHLARARDIAAAAHDLALEGDTNRELAELYMALGRNRDTLQALNRAHQCFTLLRSRHELADVGRRMARLEGDFLDVVRKWGESIESKDVHTQGHCERVADLAGALAAKAGIDEASLFWFRIGALLHDVGKLIVPAEVLNKPGKLTEEEWGLVKQHPAAGEKMLADIQFPWDITPMVRSHHERWDGQGYPDGVAGEAIPLTARILCIADVYDALTTQRSYKRAFSHLEAMEIMRRDVGKQFDPQLFARFEELVRRGTVNAPAAAQRATPSRRGSAPLVQMSEDDDLTGALVRRAFVNVTAAVLAERRRTGAPVSLLVVDVDQFKSVNDSFGHLTGDDALKMVAHCARDLMRPGQYVGRYAGDEFVVLLPGLDAAGGVEMGETLRSRVAATGITLRDDPERTITVTLSIGVATSPLHGDSFEALFNAADRALFDAKRLGRDKVIAAGGTTAGPPQLSFNRFVGRTVEVRSLAVALEQSVHGTPQLRLVIGEAGVGKSTLVRQLLPETRLRGAVMVTGRAIESGSRPAFGAWSEVLGAIHALGIAPSRTWPLLGRLVPALQGAAGRAETTPTDPLQAHQLQQELLQFLRAASEARPLLVVLEDMHWSDGATWDALEYVLSQLSSERICFALTVRAEEASYGPVRDRRQRLSRDERVRELRLERLTKAEVTEWLRGALHRADIGEDLLDFVLRHTEGNAFLVMQLLRTMVEENVFSYSGDAWTWTIPSTLHLPAGMTDLVGRRLSRLAPESMKVLVTAAAIGRTFPLALLTDAAGVGGEAVLDAVDAALATSVLEPARDEEDDTYQFSHALLVDAVLKSVSPTRRRATHERIAALLARRTPDAVDRVALHYAESGNGVQAFHWCKRAAARAMGLYALDEAVSFLLLALQHAQDDEERAAVHDQLARAAEQSGRWADMERSCDAILAMPAFADDPARSLSVRLRRLEARLWLGQGAREIESECRALLELSEQAGTLADVVQTRSLLSQTLVRAGEIDEAVRIANVTLRLADESGDESLAIEAMYAQALTLGPTDPAATADLLLRLITRARTRGDRAMEARAFLALGVARTRTRDDRAGAEAFRAALTIAHEAQALATAASASMNLGVLELRAGEYASAHEALSVALRLYTTQRNNARRLAALYNLANLERERNDPAAALPLYREAAQIASELGAGDLVIGAHAGIGLSALVLGDPLSARSALDTASRALNGRDEWWFQGRELLESLAVRLDARAGRFPSAAARVAVAIERLEAMDVYQAAWLVADCAAELAEEVPAIWESIDRLGSHPTVEQFVPLAARFTALRDMAERLDVAQQRGPNEPSTYERAVQ